MRDLLVLVPSFVVPGLVSIVSVPLLFASLGPAQYGTWALMFAIGNGVPQLTASWLESTTLRFGHRQTTVSGVALGASSLAISAAAGGVAAALLIPNASSGSIVATGIFTSSVGGYLIAIAGMQSRMRFGLVSWSASVRSAIGGIAGVAAAALTQSATAAILGLAGGFGIAGAAVLVDARKADRETPRSADIVRGGAFVRYGLASVVFAIALLVLNVADRFIIAAYRPLTDVGVYAATYAVVDLLFRLPPAVLAVAVRPRLFRAWDAQHADLNAAAITSMATAVLWASGLMTLGLVLLSSVRTGLPLRSDLVGLLAIGIGTFGSGHLFGLIFSAQVRQARIAASAAIAASLNIGMNLVLVPAQGLTGAAIATSVSYVAYLVLNIPAVGRAGWSLRSALVFGACMSASVAAAFASESRFWPWPALLAASLLGGTAPTVLIGTRRILLSRS